MHLHCRHELIKVLSIGIAICAMGVWGETTAEKSTLSGDYDNPYQVPVDPVNVLHSVDLRDGVGMSDPIRQNLSEEHISYKEFKREKKEDDREPPKAPSKISPVLRRWLAGEKTADEPVEVIVTFREDLRIPLLPELAPGQTRHEKETRRAAAIADLKERRRASQSKLLEGLRKRGNFEIKRQFWLTNSVVVEMPLEATKAMADVDAVTYIQPVEGGEKPPQDANPNNDVADGRRVIVSDPYYNLGLTQPWMGLLDTGVRDSHDVFNSPDHLAWLRDCVNGGDNCNESGNPGYDTTDFAWNHGTKSAGVLVGNDQLGNAYRGVTEIQLDSWQIYTAAGLHSGATVSAFESAVAAFDKVLVGEIQADEGDNGAIALAADAAYDAGAIVVAANGNFGPAGGSVRSPGIAHKVLGVGARYFDDLTQYNNQGRGPADDGRYKPDIQAPSLSETASNTGDSALAVFSGTSGATPYAAAAAMLARNWLHRMGSYDNGQTYAFMILYGNDPYPYDNTVGAGMINMAVNGHAYWGKYTVNDGQTINIPIEVGSNRRDFDAALWWPESQTQDHNDIDVHLIDPGGVERARGYSGVSVFERAKVVGNLMPGQWTLRIRGYFVRTGAQVVYMAAHIRRH